MEDITYRFSHNVSRKKVLVITALDKLLSVFFTRKTKDFEINEITVTQLAHIGDLILTLPALKKLKAATNYKVNLVVNSQNYNIASKVKFLDKVIVADAPWFSRGKKVTYGDFIRQLRDIKTDLLFDVRGDLRNNVFLKFFTRKAAFAGYNVGGGDALLDRVLPFQHGGHATAFLDPLFDLLQLPQSDLGDYWDPEDVPNQPIDDESFNQEFMIVHLGAGAQSRRWPVSNFIEVIKSIAREMPVYVLGTSQDATEEELNVISAIPNVKNCVGKYSILQSIYILKKCSLFLGLESGFSHIAAMLKKKSFVLFSGTSNVNVWKPYSFYEDQVVILKHEVPCNLVTGCGKFICEDNICLKQILPFEVSSIVAGHLENNRALLKTQYN